MNKMAIHTHVIFRPDVIRKKRRKTFVEQGIGCPELFLSIENKNIPNTSLIKIIL